MSAEVTDHVFPHQNIDCSNQQSRICIHLLALDQAGQQQCVGNSVLLIGSGTDGFDTS